MAVRSPSYPSIPLENAILRAKDLFKAERFNPISREAAAKLLGYSGLTGGSNTLLSDLNAYGLIERSGKGEIRVTQLVAQILHPKDDEEFRDALLESANRPKLFSELRERFPDNLPTEDNLEGVLVRMGFSSKGTRPAMKAFLETFQYLEEQGVSESHGAPIVADVESSSQSHDGRLVTPPPQTHKKREVEAGMKEATFPLREGNVVLQLPEHMSKASFDTVKMWIDLVLNQLSVDDQKDDADGD